MEVRHFFYMKSKLALAITGLVCSASINAQEHVFLVHKPTEAKISSCSINDGDAVVTREAEAISACSQWEVVTTGDYFHLKNRVSNKHILPASADNGAAIVVRPDTWKGNWSQWSFAHRSEGYGHLVNRATGKYIYASGAEGEALQQQPSSWAGNYTQWSFKPVVVKGPAKNIIEAESGEVIGSGAVYPDLSASGDEQVSFVQTEGAAIRFENVDWSNRVNMRYIASDSGEVDIIVNGALSATLLYSPSANGYLSVGASPSIAAGSTVEFALDKADTTLRIDSFEFEKPFPVGDWYSDVSGADWATVGVFDAEGSLVYKNTFRSGRTGLHGFTAGGYVGPLEWLIVDQPEDRRCEIVDIRGIIDIDCVYEP